MLVTGKHLDEFRQEVVKIISSKNKKIADLENRIERLETCLSAQSEVWHQTSLQYPEQVPPVEVAEESGD